MKPFLAIAFALVIAGSAVLAVAQSPAPQTPAPAAPKQPPTPTGPDPNSQYRLGPDSMPQPGVPQGEIRGPFTLKCDVYPGTQHTYWSTCRRNTTLPCRPA